MGGGFSCEDRGDDGEILMEVEGPGEWGWEAGLPGWWRFTVSGERPGVGGRKGRFFWGDSVKSQEEIVWGGLDERRWLLCWPTLEVKWRLWHLSFKNPDVTVLSSTFGGERLLQWWSLLRVADDSVVLGFSSGSEGLWWMVPRVTLLDLDPEVELLAPSPAVALCCSSSFRSMDKVRKSICCTTWKICTMIWSKIFLPYHNKDKPTGSLPQWTGRILLNLPSTMFLLPGKTNKQAKKLLDIFLTFLSFNPYFVKQTKTGTNWWTPHALPCSTQYSVILRGFGSPMSATYLIINVTYHLEYFRLIST